MPYKQILHNDATKQERLWLCTSHFDELLIPDQAHRSRYIDTAHLSGIFAQPLTVLFAGYGRWFAGEQMIRYEQPGVLGIEYVRSGDVVLAIDAQEYLLQPGDVYFLHGAFPEADRTGPSGRLAKRFVWLTGTVLENLLRSLHLWDRKFLTIQQPRKLEACLRRMTTLLAANQPDVDIVSSTLAYQILLILGQSIRPSLPLILDEALAFLQQHLHQQLHMRDICEHLDMSEINLRRLFARHMHISPMKYFLRQKLNWSANMLCTTTYAIKEIAYEAGYEDPLYFSNQFKKQFGVSPRQYRDVNRTSGK